MSIGVRRRRTRMCLHLPARSGSSRMSGSTPTIRNIGPRKWMSRPMAKSISSASSRPSAIRSIRSTKPVSSPRRTVYSIHWSATIGPPNGYKWLARRSMTLTRAGSLPRHSLQVFRERCVPEIVTKTIHCAGGLPAFLAMPTGGGDKIPAVVLMHERYGLVKHTCDLAERFARDGFVCIAPDFFYRHPDQDALHRGDVGYPIKDAESNAHIATAIAELAKLPQVDRGKIAVKGVCQTGRYPLVYAAEHPIA